MESTAVIVVLAILLIAVSLVFADNAHDFESGHSHGPGTPTGGRREHYGPPPGMYRALSHEELDNRGWPEYPYEYTANTASSISHMIERSA
jgi:hypothetical protein